MTIEQRMQAGVLRIIARHCDALPDACMISLGQSLREDASVLEDEAARSAGGACEHSWSEPGINDPPSFCLMCGTPKVRLQDMKAAPAPAATTAPQGGSPSCGGDILGRGKFDHERTSEPVKRYRHLKRGTDYELERRSVEVQTGRPIVEGDLLVVYVGSNGRASARLEEEFYDGRFIEIPETPGPSQPVSEPEKKHRCHCSQGICSYSTLLPNEYCCLDILQQTKPESGRTGDEAGRTEPMATRLEGVASAASFSSPQDGASSVPSQGKPMRAALFGEQCVYLMSFKGDVYRVSMEWDGAPRVDAYALHCQTWPREIVDEHDRVAERPTPAAQAEGRPKHDHESGLRESIREQGKKRCAELCSGSYACSQEGCDTSCLRGYIVELEDQLALTRAPSSAQGVSEEVGAFAIKVEKRLCEALGREWRASGMSIESLITDLAARSAQGVTTVGDAAGFSLAEHLSLATRVEGLVQSWDKTPLEKFHQSNWAHDARQVLGSVSDALTRLQSTGGAK